VSPRLGPSAEYLGHTCPPRFLASLVAWFLGRAALQIGILVFRHQIDVLECSAKKRAKLTAAPRLR